MLVAQNIELFTLALSGITIILISNKGPKYWTVRLNTGNLATLNMKYINHPPYLTTWIRHWLSRSILNRIHSTIYLLNTKLHSSLLLSQRGELRLIGVYKSGMKGRDCQKAMEQEKQLPKHIALTYAIWKRTDDRQDPPSKSTVYRRLQEYAWSQWSAVLDEWRPPLQSIKSLKDDLDDALDRRTIGYLGSIRP